MADIASTRASRYRILPDFERNQIIAKRLAGLSNARIAKDHGIDPVTVWRLCKDLKHGVAEASRDWRAEQGQLAIQSVNRALVDDSDTYKSAGIAVQALRGLGVYTSDSQVSVNVANWLESRPREASTIAARARVINTSHHDTSTTEPQDVDKPDSA